jgi:SAM-dependent methyltransferase
VTNTEWPFDSLPAAARVWGDAVGQLADQHRAQRKEYQLRSMLRCIFALNEPKIVDHAGDETLSRMRSATTIVDFGGGTGHLAIPLALLQPHVTVIVVDLLEKSIELLHSKANECGHTTTTHPEPPTLLQRQLRQCETIPNLYTFLGPLEAFDGDFDIGVALHLCGEATDVALRKCGLANARAIVFAPCCVGKLNPNVKNPYIRLATGSDTPSVLYPQSSLFQRHVTVKEDWNALARAADYGDAQESRTIRNAARRTAKALLETDRRLVLEEQFGYCTALTRMDPWEATPKNDILLAWKDKESPSWLLPNRECEEDIQRTMEHLLCQPTTRSSEQDCVDWTAEEEAEIRRRLEDFVQSDKAQLVFPTGTGGRGRKLVHYVAEQMSLLHFGCGKRKSEKVVVVERKREVAAT